MQQAAETTVLGDCAAGLEDHPCRRQSPPWRRMKSRRSARPMRRRTRACRAASGRRRPLRRSRSAHRCTRHAAGRGDPRPHRRLGGVEDFLHAYALSTKEGLALMVLAEALLRVPDADTADRLIEDKLKAGDWAHHDARSAALLVSASAWTLGITARVIQPGETPEGIVEALVKRLGLPAVRAATRQAMRLLGSHFVLGQTIDEALARAGRGARVSLFLRHAGRGRAHRRRCRALFRILTPTPSTPSASSAGNAALPQRPGISVKLSALHPRYEPLSRDARAQGAGRRSCSSWRGWRRAMNSISPSTPRRPTGWNCRST